MSTRGSNRQGEEYLRAAWKEQKHIEDEYACLVEITVHPDARLGVYCFHFEAHGPVINVGLFAPLAAIKAPFPHVSSATLEGFLMGELMKLSSMVAQARGPEWAGAPAN